MTIGTFTIFSAPAAFSKAQVLNLENRRGALDHVRPVVIPDVCPSKILCPPGVEPNPEEPMTPGAGHGGGVKWLQTPYNIEKYGENKGLIWVFICFYHLITSYKSFTG